MTLTYSCDACKWIGTEPAAGGSIGDLMACPMCRSLEIREASFAGLPKPRDGGPAFPRAGHFTKDGPSETDCSSQDGMSLRDYFAAKAMESELTTAGANEDAAIALATAAQRHGQTVEQRIAFNAYRQADAMLAERAIEWSEEEREAMR